MILFKKIGFKNFLSYGNTLTSIDFDSHDGTLIIGKNGEGKSTIMDALTYALFGKPFRKINKDQLINTINNKDCYVEVEFSTNNSMYKVIRGMKPNKFEVYYNDVLLNQDSKNRDYQKILEQQILKFNYRSFTQIVVLGSAKFQPFMQLPTFARREIIEDLLDLSIFSTISNEIKQTLALEKSHIQDISTEIKLLKQSINDNKDFLSHIESNKDSQLKSFLNDLDNTEVRISKLNEKLIDFENKESQIKTSEELEILQNNINSINTEIHLIENNLSKVRKDFKFYNENDTCPTCSQSIDNSMKEHKCEASKNKMDSLLENKSGCESKLDEAKNQYNIELLKFNDFNKQKNTLITEINNLNKYFNDLNKKIDKLKTEDDISFNDYQIKLDELTNSLNFHETNYKKSFSKLKYYDLCMKLTSDNGIKSKIISTYIPMINSLVNKYLSMMDFYVSFYLDENFNETIKSRYRDTFSYSSFSEGEKMRIDLALLFTWREISKLKNSTSTNIIIMDEITDSSLDAEGIRDFTNILKAFDKGIKVFIISHNDKMRDKFERTLLAEKVGNFSTLHEI